MGKVSAPAVEVEVLVLEEVVDVLELAELVDESPVVSSSIRIMASPVSFSSWGQSSVRSEQIVATASGHSVPAPSSSSMMVKRPVRSVMGVSADWVLLAVDF